MSNDKQSWHRPLSPHLSIWKWHATMIASTAHRLSGIALWAGSFLLAAWVVALYLGPVPYRYIEILLTSLPSQVILFLFTAIMLYHWANGIRFLVWDGPNIGFDPRTASLVSILIFVFSVFGTSLVWLAIYLRSGSYS